MLASIALQLLPLMLSLLAVVAAYFAGRARILSV
jgi:hypothetical protein